MKKKKINLKQNTTSVNYEGNVGYDIVFNNKPLSVSYHNSGTEALQLAFAMLMSGNLGTISSYVPKYLDIINTAKSSSYLLGKINLSGSRYDKQSGNWVAIHNAVVDVANIRTTAPVGSYCVMQLIASDKKTVIAEVTVSSDETINLIANNVSGLITWMMRVNL